MRTFRRLFGVVSLASLATALLVACAEPIATSTPQTAEKPVGIRPNIVPGDVAAADREALSAWISEAVALFQTEEFERNFVRASGLYPKVYVSQSQDIIPTTRLLQRLKTDDKYLSVLWWPKSYVGLSGETATRSRDRTGFGFDARRDAVAGPFPAQETGTRTGEIKLGRLHFARFTQGDVVEKSCAMNTMVHEISHTLSDREDIFWMHILDSQQGVTPPRGVFEASYFIGVVAQCTFLENQGRIERDNFDLCMKTFSDPETGSRFRSRACDDFPGDRPITPENRILP